LLTSLCFFGSMGIDWATFVALRFAAGLRVDAMISNVRLEQVTRCRQLVLNIQPVGWVVAVAGVRDGTGKLGL
jgi:hypothetical protein